MIIKALADLYDELLQQRGENKFPTLGWCIDGVSYGLEISNEGEVFNVKTLEYEEVSEGKTKLHPSERIIPERRIRSGKPPIKFFM